MKKNVFFLILVSFVLSKNLVSMDNGPKSPTYRDSAFSFGLVSQQDNLKEAQDLAGHLASYNVIPVSLIKRFETFFMNAVDAKCLNVIKFFLQSKKEVLERLDRDLKNKIINKLLNSDTPNIFFDNADDIQWIIDQAILFGQAQWLSVLLKDEKLLTLIKDLINRSDLDIDKFRDELKDYKLTCNDKDEYKKLKKALNNLIDNSKTQQDESSQSITVGQDKSSNKARRTKRNNDACLLQ